MIVMQAANGILSVFKLQHILLYELKKNSKTKVEQWTEHFCESPKNKLFSVVHTFVNITKLLFILCSLIQQTRKLRFYKARKNSTNVTK